MIGAIGESVAGDWGDGPDVVMGAEMVAGWGRLSRAIGLNKIAGRAVC